MVTMEYLHYIELEEHPMDKLSFKQHTFLRLFDVSARSKRMVAEY